MKIKKRKFISARRHVTLTLKEALLILRKKLGGQAPADEDTLKRIYVDSKFANAYFAELITRPRRIQKIIGARMRLRNQ